MSDQSTQPTAGYGSKRANSIWFSAKNGVFNFKLRDDKGTKSEPLQCDYVHGQMASVEIRWKEASGEIAGHEELVITLGGSDHNGEDVLLKVCTHYPSTCAKMLVGYLPSVKAGEHVACGVWGSKDNAKVTFGKMTRVVGSSDVALPRKTDAPKSDREAENRALEGLSGPARERKRRELMDAFSAELDAWMRPIVQGHPCFLDQDPREETSEAETEGDTDPKSRSANPAPNAAASAAPAQDAAAGTETASASSSTSADAGQPPQDKKAFGFVPERWPLEKDWNVDPSPKILASLRRMVAQFDEDLGVQDESGDLFAPLTSVFTIGNALFEEYGLPKSAYLGRGRAMLLYDFLAHSSQEATEELWDAAFPKKAVSSDEYDPFAEE